MRPKAELVRVVRRPDGTAALDPTGRANGRGAYLCRDAACWDVAARRRALERALGVTLPADLTVALTAGPGPLAGLTPNLEPDPHLTPDTPIEGGPHGQE